MDFEFKPYEGQHEYGDLVVDGVHHRVRVLDTSGATVYVQVFANGKWEHLVHVDGSMANVGFVALRCAAKVLSAPKGGKLPMAPTVVQTRALDAIVDEIGHLQAGVAVLERVWFDLGSDRKLSEETAQLVARYFKFDDSE